MQLRNRYVPSIYDRKPSYENRNCNKRSSYPRKSGYNMKATHHKKPNYEENPRNDKTLDMTFKSLRKTNKMNYQKELLFIENQQSQIIKKLNDLKNAIR